MYPIRVKLLVFETGDSEILIIFVAFLDVMHEVVGLP